MRERPTAPGALVMLGATLGLLAAISCTRPNPLYHKSDGGTGGIGDGGSAGTGGNGGAGGGSGGGGSGGGGVCSTNAFQDCPNYTQKAGTACVVPGKQFCADGQWQPCIGQVNPAPGESCNGVDDDCNSST